MNFNGIFEEWNYITQKEIEETLSDFIKPQVTRLRQSEVDEIKSLTYESPQFMDHVVRGMRNFLKSPF